MTALLHPAPKPTEICLRTASKILEIAFDDGARFDLPCEFLRVYSPSAEVRGHGPGQEILQLGKQDVNIVEIEPAGSYGVQLHFSDGHNTGIYSWEYLHELGSNRAALWEQYQARVKAAPPQTPAAGGGCGSGGCGH